MGSKNNNAGFTLIELLVVIAIIAILATVLLPSLQKAMSLAKATVCSSNMKNMATGCMMYATDNEGFLPPGRYGPTALLRRQTWMMYIASYTSVEPYVGGNHSGHMIKTLFLCPSDDSAWLPAGYSGLTQFFCAKNSYSANYAVMDEIVQDADFDGIIGPRRLSDISRASETIMLMEGHHYMANVIGYGDGCVNCWEGARPDGWGYHWNPENVSGYHNKENNWAFSDGHVESMAYDDTLDGINLWVADK